MATNPSKSAQSGGFGPAQVIASLAVLLSAFLILSPPLIQVQPALWHGSGAIILAIGLWSTGAIPEYLTALVFFLLCLVLNFAPPEVVFAGFHSSAVWLVFGGLVLGLSIHRTGLGERVSRQLQNVLPHRYAGLIASIYGFGLIMAFFIPSSMGRVVLIIPVVLALAARLGFERGSNGYVALILAGALGAILPGFTILPANVPNIVLLGMAETLYDKKLSYGAYLLLNFPVLALGASLIIVPLILKFFPDKPAPLEATHQKVPFARDERVLIAILVLTLGFWATDVIHGVSPAWIAVAAAIACVMPRLGVMPPDVVAKEFNLGPWFFVAGVIGLGAVAVHIGLADALGPALGANLPGSGIGAYLALFATALVVGIFACIPATPAVLTPIAGTLAGEMGWPLQSVLFAQVPAWVIFPFPYQVPPMIVALTLSGLTIGRILPFFLTYFAVATVLLVPLHYLWGRALGVFP